MCGRAVFSLCEPVAEKTIESSRYRLLVLSFAADSVACHGLLLPARTGFELLKSGFSLHNQRLNRFFMEFRMRGKERADMGRPYSKPSVQQENLNIAATSKGDRKGLSHEPTGKSCTQVCRRTG